MALMISSPIRFLVPNFMNKDRNRVRIYSKSKFSTHTISCTRASLITNPYAFEVGRSIGSYSFMNVTSASATGSEQVSTAARINRKMAGERKKACVTGGNGFMASLLIRQLLAKGYAVNATVRDPENLAKVSHLKKLQGPAGGVELFRAELVEEGSFDAAVTGCDYVFHVAAPVNAMAEDPENELIRPGIEGMLNVFKSCMKARVKRVVMTSSAGTVSAKPFGETTRLEVDEDSWSDVEFLTTKKPPIWGYLVSKTLTEKTAWQFARDNKLDLVTIAPPLMLGTPLTHDAAPSVRMGLSLFFGDEALIIKLLEDISVPLSIVHVEDVCRAHIFVAETEAASGRYICCAIDTSLLELSMFLSQRYPQYKVFNDFTDSLTKAKLTLSSKKLIKEGFEYKHTNLEEIYDEIVEFGRAVGLIK